MLFISDTKYYVPIKLCKMAGSIQLFKIMGTVTSENVKLKRNKIWDIMEIDWKEVNETLNGIKSIYQNQSQYNLDINSKLDALSKENTCPFISC